MPHPRFSLGSGSHGVLRVGDPCPVPAFREFNFVYGVNASGKTTLAAAIAQTAYGSDVGVKLFNRSYVDTVLAEVDDVGALWIVADDASDLIAVRDRQRRAREKRELDQASAKADLVQAGSAYTALLEEIANELRPLRRAIKGIASKYAVAEVESSLESVEANAKEPIPNRKPLSLAIHQEALRSLTNYEIEAAAKRVGVLLEFAEGDDLADVGSASLHRWATRKEAIDIAVTGAPCPFCSQDLTDEAVAVVQRRASEPAPVGEDRSQELARAIQQCRNEIVTAWPMVSEFEQSLQEKARVALETCVQVQTELQTQMPSEEEAIRELTQVDQSDGGPTWIAQARNLEKELLALAAVIVEHESERNDQEEKREAAVAKYEESLFRESHASWLASRKARDEAWKRSESASEQLSAATRALQASEDRLRGLMPPENLNEDLRRYLGHEAIRFEASGDGDGEEEDFGYRVVRLDGEIALGLSEGERTAIALLYFLQYCRASGTESEAEVVILDDPVTSLDDSSLYTAHAFIENTLRRDHGSDGPSVVILTHNHAFFRLLIDWSERLNRKSSDGQIRERALLLETMVFRSAGDRLCLVREMPEELANAGSEYAVLLARLVSAHEGIALSPNCEPHEALEILVLPNLARRVLEGFLAFKFGGSRRPMIGELLDVALGDERLDGFGLDRRGRLHKLLNAGSHGAGLVDTYQPSGSSNEIDLLVGDVVEVIKRLDPGHLRAFTSE